MDTWVYGYELYNLIPVPALPGEFKISLFIYAHVNFIPYPYPNKSFIHRVHGDGNGYLLPSISDQGSSCMTLTGQR